MRKLKNVLIVGGSGFIGTHLALRLRYKYKVFATYHKNPFRVLGVTYLPLDSTEEVFLKRLVYTITPDIIIYSAGKNSVDWAEENSREADRIHAGGSVNVSTAADIFKPKFILLSNCYVFDGNRGNYKETDTLLPTLALGKSKVSSENYIRGRSLNYSIIRSSPVFGRGNGIAKTFLDHLRLRLSRNQRIEVPNTQLHSFAPVYGLIDLVETLIEGGPRNKVFHYGGLTKMTYYDFAKSFAARFGFDPSLVTPFRYQTTIGSEEGPMFDYSLNSSYVVKNLKVKPLLIEEGFDLFEQNLV